MKGKYLLPQEAAEYLGISLSTLYRVEQRGAIKPIRTPGGHRRYAVDMLDGYLTAAASSFKPRRRVVARAQLAEATVSVTAAPVAATTQPTEVEEPVAVEEPTVEPAMAAVETETEQTWVAEQAAPSPVSAHAIDLSAAQPTPLFKPSAHVLDLRGGQA